MRNDQIRDLQAEVAQMREVVAGCVRWMESLTGAIEKLGDSLKQQHATIHADVLAALQLLTQKGLVTEREIREAASSILALLALQDALAEQPAAGRGEEGLDNGAGRPGG